MRNPNSRTRAVSRSMIRPALAAERRDLEWVIFVLLAVGLLALAAAPAHGFGPYRKSDLPANELGAHGAMAMAAQQKMLDHLLPARDVTKPPPQIDPEMWGLIVPKDNELTPERVALGRRLYFETRLSADGTVACATCHDVTRGFTDERPTSEGIARSDRQAQRADHPERVVLPYAVLGRRVPTLEEQAKLPIINPIEMGQPDEQAVSQRSPTIPSIRRHSSRPMGAHRTSTTGRAIASFERTLVFLDAPFDRFLAGDTERRSPRRRQGGLGAVQRQGALRELPPDQPARTRSAPTTAFTTSASRRAIRTSRHSPRRRSRRWHARRVARSRLDRLASQTDL